MSASQYLSAGTGDLPPSAAASRPTETSLSASWQEQRRQWLAQAETEAATRQQADIHNHHNNNIHKSGVPRGYARTGPTGRSFSWPVLCCLIIGGPVLVILGRGDKKASSFSSSTDGNGMVNATNNVTAMVTASPTENVNIRPEQPPTLQPSNVPTPTPTLQPTSVPSTQPSSQQPIDVSVHVDLVATSSSGLYFVHALEPLSLSVHVPQALAPSSYVAVYPGEYLVPGEECHDAWNATYSWRDASDDDDDDDDDEEKVYNNNHQKNETIFTPNATLAPSWFLPVNASNVDEDDNQNSTSTTILGVDLNELVDTTLALCINDTVAVTSYHLFPAVNFTEPTDTVVCTSVASSRTNWKWQSSIVLFCFDSYTLV